MSALKLVLAAAAAAALLLDAGAEGIPLTAAALLPSALPAACALTATPTGAPTLAAR